MYPVKIDNESSRHFSTASPNMRSNGLCKASISDWAITASVRTGSRWCKAHINGKIAQTLRIDGFFGDRFQRTLFGHTIRCGLIEAIQITLQTLSGDEGQCHWKRMKHLNNLLCLRLNFCDGHQTRKKDGKNTKFFAQGRFRPFRRPDISRIICIIYA
jgi:hypothetical protein